MNVEMTSGWEYLIVGVTLIAFIVAFRLFWGWTDTGGSAQARRARRELRRRKRTARRRDKLTAKLIAAVREEERKRAAQAARALDAHRRPDQKKDSRP
ncbi:hypothetical protein ACWENQ_44830 [Nonomuraea sp. NPDC004354]